MDRNMEAAVLSLEQVKNVAKQLHIQFAHYMESWEDLSLERRRPYIRAATLLIAARNRSNMEND